MALSIWARKSALEQAGFKDMHEMQEMNKAIEANPSLAALSKQLAKDPDINDETQKKLLISLGKKWKEDPTVFSKLEADLQANPQLSAQVTAAMKSDPDKMITQLGQYKGGNLLPQAAAPATGQPAAPSTTTAPVAVPAGSSAATPQQQPVQAPAAPATTAGASQAPQTPPEQDMETQYLTALAGLSDADIKKQLKKEDVKAILTGMGDQAGTKFGVDGATVAGFKKRVGTDDKLLTDITTTFQNNPEFVRQLARAGKDKTPLSKEMQDMARGTMTSVMENPENLAKDSYVRDLSRKMDAADKFGSSGFGKVLSGLFGEGFGAKISAWFGQIMDSIGKFFSGFIGKPVIAMNSVGGSLSPVIMKGNYLDNQNANAAFARNSPNDMKAFPILGADGKMFHEVVTKDANGQDVKKQEPNTITVKTADGKDVKIIPAAGNLEAKQIAGNFDPAGKFMPGNYQVPVVTAIDQNGNASKIRNIEMTPVDFARYKAQVDAEGQRRGGPFQTLAVENYTADDAIKQGKAPQPLQIVAVNAATGVVTQPTTLTPGVTAPVANPARNAANDPEYNLQVNG